MAKPKLCRECELHTIGADVVHWYCHDSQIRELEAEIAVMENDPRVADTINELRAQWLPYHTELSTR